MPPRSPNATRALIRRGLALSILAGAGGALLFKILELIGP